MHRGATTATRNICATTTQFVRHASAAATATTKATAKPSRSPKPSARVPSSSPAAPKGRQVQNDRIARPVVRMLDKMVKGAKENGGPPWTHMPSRRGEEMRLKQRVKEAANPTYDIPGPGALNATISTALGTTAKTASVAHSSSSSQAFGAPMNTEQLDQEEEFGYIPEAPLGSFVELRRNDVIELGVVVGSGFLDRQWKISILTKEGESWVSIKQDIFFSIPSICPADLAARCGTQPVPESEAQLNARVEVLKRLRGLQRQVESATIAISRELNSLYETLRARDPNEWAEVSATEVAKIFHKTPTAVEIFATHKLLMEDSTRFVASLSYQTNHTFRVRPLKDVQNMLQVQEWVRKRHPSLQEFFQKAKKVIRVQEALTEKTKTEGPTLERAEHQWNESDKAIIQFLTAALRPGRAVQTDPYIVGAGHILKSFYNSCDMNHMDDSLHQFLVAIGVFTPWQDLILIDPHNKLDLETRPTVLNQRDQNILRALEKSTSPVPTHPDDFHASDPMASIRRDWGNMPVYVVDDVIAEELDDGISFERIPSEPDNIWIHVHVADPASVIPPTNFLAQQAAQQSETLYMVPKSFPLFPKCIIHHPTHGLSLGMRSSQGLPDRVMTFSIKLNSEGNVLDQTVQAGLVRNVKVVDYDTVDAGLGLGTIKTDLPFSGSPPPRTFTPLAPEIVEDMKVFGQVAEVQRQLRISKNWFIFEGLQAFVKRGSGDFPAETGGRVNTPYLHRGFPDTVYTVEHMSRSSEHGSRAIIAEIMKLAARAASRFCLEKGIPVLRRTSNPMVPMTEEAIHTILASRDKLGYVKEEDVLRYILYTPGAEYKTYPGMHYGVGVAEGEGYVRVTSPLRRYGDLVTHWQIQHALLNGKPKWGLDWMEDFAVTLATKDQYIKSTTKRHHRFWALQYIKRWQEIFRGGRNEHLWPRDMEGKPIEDPLEGLEGLLLTLPMLNRITGERQASIKIPKLGLKELLVNLPDEFTGTANLGMRLPLRVRNIHLGVKPLMMLELDKSRKLSL